MTANSAPTKENIRDEIVSFISKKFNMDSTDINASTLLSNLEMCSLLAVQLSAHLKNIFNIDAHPAMISTRPLGDVAAALARPA